MVRDHCGNRDGSELRPYSDAAATVRLTAAAEPMRSEVAHSMSEISKRTGVVVTFGPQATSHKPADGEIIVGVEPNPCGGAAGCGMQETYGTGGLMAITSGLVTVRPEYASGNKWLRQLLLHEFGHVVGLSHFDEKFNGSYQTMRWMMTEGVNDFRSGYLNGLAVVRQRRAALMDERKNAPQTPKPTASRIAGAIDSIVAGSGTATVNGWAYDSTSTTTMVIAQVAGGPGYGMGQTLLARPDVAKRYPTYGQNTGYSVTIDGLDVGTHEICVTAGIGDLHEIGCKSVTITEAAPNPAPLMTLETDNYEVLWHPVYLDGEAPKGHHEH